MTTSTVPAPHETTNELIARLMSENAALAATLADLAADPMDLAEEVRIELPETGLPDNRRRSHYEGDTEGVASFRSAAARHGEKVLYPPYQSGGEAHRTIAAVLAERGIEIGDAVTHRDMAWIPGRDPNQARFGSEASRRTAIHRLANGGFLSPVHAAGSKKASGYLVTDLMWAHLEG